jgi:murein DD-endopeptidase MepM/ murein hydrolase activator NlpD
MQSSDSDNWNQNKLLSPLPPEKNSSFKIFCFLIVFFTTLLTGCTDDVITHSSPDVDQPVYTSQIFTKPTLTTMPSRKETFTPIPTSTPIMIAKVKKSSENKDQVLLCSPLGAHSLKDLPNLISSSYNPPPMGKDDRHQGIDFAYYNDGIRSSIDGEGVQAIMSGWVVIANNDRLPYGNMVILETPFIQLPEELKRLLEILPDESIYHLYAHFGDPPLASQGTWVECGQLIGFVGSSGYNVPVPHLHLESRIGPSGARFDGMAFYDTQANETEMENYTTWRMSGLFKHFDPLKLFRFRQDDADNRHLEK